MTKMPLERLENLCKDIERVEEEIGNCEDNLYHIRLEIQMLLKKERKR